MSKMMNWLVLIFNIGGVGLYLLLASSGWRDPSENRAVPITGEPYAWAICLPVLIALITVDIVWGVAVFKKPVPWGKASLTLCLAILTCSIVIDFAHH